MPERDDFDPGLFPIDAVVEVVANAADAYAPDTGTKVPAGSTGVRIVLVKGVTTTGHLLDAAGAPVPKAALYCVPMQGGTTRFCMTDEKGRFELLSLPKATWTASAQLTPAGAGGPGSDKIPCGRFETGASDVVLRLAK